MIEEVEKRSTVSSRIFYLDYLRALACVLVIITHISANYCYSTVGSFSFWLGGVLNSQSRICVPIFVMISGALLLDEAYLFQRGKWLRHIQTLLLFYVFWSAVYCVLFQVLQNLVQGQPLNITNIFSAFLVGHTHLWYVLMTVGLYLLLPLLRLWVKETNKKYVEYFLILAFLTQSLIPQIVTLLHYIAPGFTAIETVFNHIYLTHAAGYLGYFVLGWYLSKFQIKRRRVLTVLGCAAPAVMLAENYFLSMSLGYFSSLHGFFNVAVVVMAVFVFSEVRRKFEHHDEFDTNRHRIVHVLSRNSLGIYATHLAVMGVVNLLLGSMTLLLKICIQFVAALGISLAASLVLKKVPGLKKFV